MDSRGHEERLEGHLPIREKVSAGQCRLEQNDGAHYATLYLNKDLIHCEKGGIHRWRIGCGLGVILSRFVLLCPW